MLSIEDQIEVRCSLTDAWDLLTRFDDVARLMPTVENVEVDGDRVHGRVAVRLGRLAVSSRITLEVTHREPLACLKAEGVSYLGETIERQVAQGGVRGIDSGSVGRLRLHLDLRPSDEERLIRLIYRAEVEAQGRLQRIYQSILKSKAPAMMAEFAANLRTELERLGRPEGTGEAPGVAALPEASTLPAPLKKPWWSRLLDWFRARFSSTGSRRGSPR